MDTSRNKLGAVRRFLAESEDFSEGDSESRFGKIALAQRYITALQLRKCLTEQNRLSKDGSPLLLGQILLKNGYLSTEQYLDVLRSQGLPPDSPPAPDGDVPSRRVGKYRLVRKIGQGGMGIVYEAEDPTLRRRVAIKFLRVEETDEATVARLHREAAIAAQLRHPNIVGVHEVGTMPDAFGQTAHFIVMDYVEGQTLAEVMEDPQTPRAVLLRMLEEISGAVGYAHESGVVHRDLKPANVLVDQGGRAILTDFGLAKADRFGTKLTRSFEVLGTPQYMAPEQVKGATQEINSRTDVYGLGVILYEILAGRTPFAQSPPAALYDRIVNEEPPRPDRVRARTRPAVERDLDAICSRAMEKEAHRRYSNAGEFAEDLARFRRGEPIHAHRPSLLYRLRKRLAKRRGILVTAGAAAVVALALVTLVVLHFKGVRESDRNREARENAETQRLLKRSERYRWVQQHKIKPLMEKIVETKPFLYIKDVDIRPKLEGVENSLRQLEEIVKDPVYADITDVWVLLGMGWYFVGDARKAESALREAERLDPLDARMHYYLGRIFLRRSILERLLTGRRITETQKQRSKKWSELAWRHLQMPGVEGVSSGAIDRHLAEAYLALSQRDLQEVLRLCFQGLVQFGTDPGTEEYWSLIGWVRGGGSRNLSLHSGDRSEAFLRVGVFRTKHPAPAGRRLEWSDSGFGPRRQDQSKIRRRLFQPRDLAAEAGRSEGGARRL